MESTLRAPRAGDMVIVLAQMMSGNVTEMSGYVEEISMGFVYFALDAICLGRDPEADNDPPFERTLPTPAMQLLRVGVPLVDLKPFNRMYDEVEVCWLVRL
jgi:hypothetical protein